MLPTWAELRAGKLPGVVLNELLGALKGLTPPFPVDDWNAGAVPLTMLDAASRVFSRAYASATAIAQGGFLRLASDDWLPLLARNKYMLEPHEAIFTEGFVTFKCSPLAGPYNINGGQFTLATAGGLRYTTHNTLPQLLNPGASLPILCKAESPGARYNVSSGQINILTVSLPGVTVSNDPVIDVDGDLIPDTWIFTYGADLESPKELADRCAYRFGRLSKLQNTPEDAYISLVKDAAAQVKKVVVFPNFLQGFAVPGACTLFLAGDTGPVAPAIVNAVKAAIDPFRCPLGTLYVASCAARPHGVQGLVEVDSSLNIPLIRDAVATNINDYQRDAGIGDLIYGAELIERVMDAEGVINFKPLNLLDVRLEKNQVVVFDSTKLIYAAVKK